MKTILVVDDERHIVDLIRLYLGRAARAFERFYRADPARSGTGSGLGLAIVREFVLRMEVRPMPRTSPRTGPGSAWSCR